MLGNRAKCRMKGKSGKNTAFKNDVVFGDMRSIVENNQWKNKAKSNE